jgi:hypothetical protein
VHFEAAPCAVRHPCLELALEVGLRRLLGEGADSVLEDLAFSASHARIVEPCGDQAPTERLPLYRARRGYERGHPRHAVREDAGCVYIAYQTFGDRPIDLAWQFDLFGNIDVMWELPMYATFFRALAGFSRVILHDRRGTGLSSRNVPAPNLRHVSPIS